MSDDFDSAPVTWVMDYAALASLTAAIEVCEEVVIDLETTGLHEHAQHGGKVNGGVAARIVLASLTLPGEGDPPTTWVLPLSHPDSPFSGRWRAVMRRVAETIRDSGKPVVNQNMKFDARWIMATTGVDLSHQITWDTQISSHLLDENESTRLKDRAPTTFGVRRWDDFDLTYPGAAEDVPMFDLGLYAARDTYWTWRLAEHHRERMFINSDEWPLGDEERQEASLGTLATWVAMPTVATMTAVEQRGMALDIPWVESEMTILSSDRTEAFVDLAYRYPDLNPDKASFGPTSRWFGTWAEAAVEAGDLRVGALTPTGKPQWSKSVLTRQARAGSEVAQRLLDYRSASKRMEFLESWLSLVSPDGRIHPSYNVGRVVTGRLSSSDPNMQQVTRSLKPAFIPTPGMVFAELDYSQIELRVAAFISKCAPMLEAFREGDDLHTLLAARITGKLPQDVEPHERQAGKSANFGLLYGMGAAGFREYAEDVYGVQFTPDEAQEVHGAFFSMWDGIAQWHAQTLTDVRRRGEVSSPIGRVRRLTDVWSGNDYRASKAERAAINSPVQGFASDLMQIAAARIEGTLPGYAPLSGVQIVGTVHDSLLVEVPADDHAAAVQACSRAMTQDVVEVLERRFHLRFDVPLVVDATVGTRWGLDDVG